MVSTALSLPEPFARTPTTPGTSNVAGADGPFQRWYNFKEAFSPRFVEEVLISMPHRVQACLDPFGGCGTTSLTCQFMGIQPTTIEVNPFLADLIEAKLTTYDVRRLREDWLIVNDRKRIHDLLPVSAPLLFEGAPQTFVEPGVRGRWIFDADVAQRILVYRDAIDSVEDAANRRLLRVLLGSVLVAVSNVVISGKGRRYRSNWQDRPHTPGEIDVLFETAFKNALYDICRYADRPCSQFQLLRGDCRERIAESGPADLVLFSPPYPNSFDYTDIYNVELWALGYLRGGGDNRRLREATLRSHVQIKRDFSAGDLGSELLSSTLDSLYLAQDELWNPHIPGMVAAYFQDLVDVLRSARNVLTDRGRIVMVVGDSSYAGVLVDVPGIVRELAPDLSLCCEEVRAVRSMRNSPQHGGDFVLSESLIRLALK